MLPLSGGHGLFAADTIDDRQSCEAQYGAAVRHGADPLRIRTAMRDALHARPYAFFVTRANCTGINPTKESTHRVSVLAVAFECTGKRFTWLASRPPMSKTLAVGPRLNRVPGQRERVAARHHPRACLRHAPQARVLKRRDITTCKGVWSWG